MKLNVECYLNYERKRGRERREGERRKKRFICNKFIKIRIGFVCDDRIEEGEMRGGIYCV